MGLKTRAKKQFLKNINLIFPGKNGINYYSLLGK